MARILVIFASLNQVALLKRSLYRMGVYVEMQRTPHCLSATGCGFALRCEPSELTLLRMKCKELRIEPGGFFEETGQAEERHYRSLGSLEIDR
jgi:hypothetical protein